MDLGSFYVPDKRFSPNVLSDLKLIHERRKMDETRSSDLSALFGYKHPTATPFYHRLNSLMAFGLLEGRGSYRITELGKKILFPESDKEDALNKTKAILNVPLWKALHDKFKKTLPSDKLWVDLKNIANVEPDEAQDAEEQIRRWYTDDISNISDNIDLNQTESETIRSSSAQDKQMSQQIVVPQTASLGQLTVPRMGTIEINDEDTLTIARSYLDVLEKKIKEKTSIPKNEPEQSESSE